MRTYTEEELREALFKTRRDNQEVWESLLRAARTSQEVHALYRYREGFDQALLQLARNLRLSLRRSPPARPPEEAAGGRFRCTRCGLPLFRERPRVWRCPGCEMRFVLGEE